MDRRLDPGTVSMQLDRQSSQCHHRWRTGTGKSFLACALAALHANWAILSVICVLARFLLTLNLARQDGSYLNVLRSLSKIDVLILDDWMRDPIQSAALKICLKYSMIVLENYPQLLFPRCQFPIGMPGFRTQLWRMPSWIVCSQCLSCFVAWRFTKKDTRIPDHIAH